MPRRNPSVTEREKYKYHRKTITFPDGSSQTDTTASRSRETTYRGGSLPQVDHSKAKSSSADSKIQLEMHEETILIATKGQWQ